jgi:hypothetical protein
MKRIVASGFLMVAPLLAHHAIRGYFDSSKTLTFTGTVTRAEFMNPHAYFYLDVVEPDGNVANWSFEMRSPVVLSRIGLRKASLKQGDMVTVEAWVAKNGSKSAAARTLTLPDGRSLDVGDNFDEQK